MASSDDRLARQIADAVAKGVSEATKDWNTQLVDALSTVTLSPAKAPEGGRWDPGDVKYRPADPDDLNRRCLSCKHFEASGACEIVKGTIDPNYVCDRYSKKMRIVERSQVPTHDVP